MLSNILDDKSIQKLQKTQDIFLNSYQNKKSFLAFLDYIYSNGYNYENIEKIYSIFGDKKRYNIFKSNLLNCGSWLQFNYYYRRQKMKLDKANFCKKDKLCQACAIRRAYKQQSKMIQTLEERKDLINRDWYYMIIPVKHNKNETLIEVYNKIMKIRRSITKAIRDKKNGRNSGVWGIFDGGLGSIEITKTQNGWNVHLNILLNAKIGSNLPIKEIKNRKGQVSYQNEQIRQFLLRQVDSQMHYISKIDFTNEDNIKKNLLEVLKYSLKFSSLDIHDLLTVYVELYKKQLFFTFGNIRGIKLEKVELEGDEKIDNEFIRIIYQRINKSYKLYEIETIKE